MMERRHLIWPRKRNELPVSSSMLMEAKRGKGLKHLIWPRKRNELPVSSSMLMVLVTQKVA